MKIAIFLNAVGPASVEVFNSFNLSEADKGKYTEVIKSFDEFCKPKTNEVYESFMFWSRKQAVGESFDQYLMDIKKRARTCNFGNVGERMLRDRIVFGTSDKALQKRYLEVTDLTYPKAVEMARAAEAIMSQSTEMQTSGQVDVVQKSLPPQYNTNTKTQPQNTFLKNTLVKNTKFGFMNSRKSETSCTFCGSIHGYGRCKAFGKMCDNCGKLNHFASVCFHRKVNEITEESSSNVLSIGMVSSTGEFDFSFAQLNNGSWYESIKIENEIINFKLDTGADVNVLPLKYLNKLTTFEKKESNDKLVGYGGSNISLIAVIECKIFCRRNQTSMTFHVTNSSHVPIIGIRDCI